MDSSFEDRFTRESIAHGETRLDVFVSRNDGKPLIILHELPGMTPAFLDYCLRMSHPDSGFKVYAPLMFKDVGTNLSGPQMGWLCIQKEFRDLYWKNRTGPSSEFSRWLLHLAAIVSGRHKGSKVGVIGMCLTGGFALVTFAEPSVNAVVCCQPAFPFTFDFASLGMTADERDAIVASVQNLTAPCALGFRYRGDILSRAVHIDAIQDLLNAPNAGETEPVERYRHRELPGRGHSTVTRVPADETVVGEIVAFLNDRL